MIDQQLKNNSMHVSNRQRTASDGMQSAKAAMTAAAKAALANEPGAAQKAADALAELERATGDREPV